MSVSPGAGVDSLPGRPSILGAFAEGTSCPAQAGLWAPRAPEIPGQVCLSSLALCPALGPWVQPLVAVWPPLRPEAAPHSPRLGRGHSWFCPSPSYLFSLTGRNPENSPEALVEFTEFAKAQSLNLEIFRPLQSGEKPKGLLLAVPVAGRSAEPQLMRTGRSDGGFVLAGVT